MSEWLAVVGAWWVDFLLATGAFLAVVLACQAVVREPARRIAIGRLAVAGVGVIGVVLITPWAGGWSLVPGTPVVADIAPGPSLVSFDEIAASAVAAIPIADGPARQGPSTGGAVGAGLDPLGWLGLAFVCGALAVAGRVVVGALRVRRLLRHARPAPRWCGDGSSSIVVSDTLGAPAVAGTWRPRIVLPATLVETEDTRLVRAAVAHERAHVDHGDTRLLAAIRVVRVVAFAQPLFWWVAQRIRTHQELLADAVAACGDRTAYAEALLGWAHTAFRRGASGIALSMASSRSTLTRRIEMLLDDRYRPEIRCPRRCWVVFVATTLAAAFAGSMLTVFPAAEASATPVNLPVGDDALAFDCTVSVHGTGAPVEGARVIVTRRRLVKRGPMPFVARTEHVSDAAGRFRVVFPPKEANDSTLYIEVQVRHDRYACRATRSNRLDRIKARLANGERPWFESLRVWPAEQVSGVATTRGGDPIPHARVFAWSRPPSKPGEVANLCMVETRCDAHGRFSFAAATPGEAAFWILPDEHAPVGHYINELRGHAGQFVVIHGFRIEGRLLDEDGAPLAGRHVEAIGRDLLPGQYRFGGASPVRRYATTDANGHFAFAPLAPGDAIVRVSESRYDPDGKGRRFRYAPFDEVFESQRVALGLDMKPIEIRAIPQVTVEAEIVVEEGASGRGMALVAGARSSRYSQFVSRPDEDGRYRARAPKGRDARLSFSRSVRVEKRDGTVIGRGRIIDLGVLDADRSVRIVYMRQPSVRFDLSFPGERPERIRIRGKYDDAAVIGQAIASLRDGVFRSYDMLPNQRVTFTVTAAGHKPATVAVEPMPGGESKTVAVAMERE